MEKMMRLRIPVVLSGILFLLLLFPVNAFAAELKADIAREYNFGSDWSVRVRLLDGTTHQPFPGDYEVTGLEGSQRVGNNGYIHIGADSTTFTITGLPEGTWWSLVPCVRKEDSTELTGEDATPYGGCFKTEPSSGTVSDTQSVKITLRDYLFLDSGYFTPVIKDFKTPEGQETRYSIEQIEGPDTEFSRSETVSYGQGSVALPVITFPEEITSDKSTLRTLKYKITGFTPADNVDTETTTLTLRIVPNKSDKLVLKPAVEYGVSLTGTKTLKGGEMEGQDFEFRIEQDGYEESTEPVLIDGTSFAGLIKRFDNNTNYKVLFTDEASPGSDTVDVSYNQDESILAWYDSNSNTVKVSSLQPGVKIKASSCRNMISHLAKIGSIDVSGLDVSAVRDMNQMFSPGYYIADTGDNGRLKMVENRSTLTSVIGLESWDTSSVESAAYMFDHCEYITAAPAFPDGAFGNAKNLKGMFSGCQSMSDISSLSALSVSSATDLSSMFKECENLSSVSPLENWDVGSVRDLGHIFEGCIGITDYSPLAAWAGKTGNVENVSYILSKSETDNIEFLRDWKTEKLKDMSGLLNECSKIADFSPLSGWKTGTVENMSYLFNQCSLLNSLSFLSGWETENVRNFSYIFANTAITGLDGLENWDVRSAEDMSSMFNDCGRLTDISSLETWGGKTAHLKNMESMFQDCSIQNLSALSEWDTSSVTSMKRLFSSCLRLTDISALQEWDTGETTDMTEMFIDCSLLEDLEPLRNWNVEKAENMPSMFYKCAAASDFSPLSGWKTRSLTDTQKMFYSSGITAESANSLSNWDMSKVTNMEEMFYACGEMKGEVNLAPWDVSAVQSLKLLFCNCDGITVLDLSGWNPTGDCTYMFSNDTSLTTIYAPDWNCVGRDIFYNCISLKGDTDNGGLSSFNSRYTDTYYCKQNGGYFHAPRPFTRASSSDWNGSVLSLADRTAGLRNAERDFSGYLSSLLSVNEDGAVSSEDPVFGADEEIAGISLFPTGGTGTVQNSRDGQIDLGPFTLSEPGVFSYTITEVMDPEQTDVTVWDESEYKLKAEAREDEDGYLYLDSVTVSGGENDGQVNFTNYMGGMTEFEIPVSKVFRNPPESFEGSFTYHLKPDETTEPKEGYELPGESPLTVTAKPGEDISFGSIIFTESGSYTFVITEDDTEEEFVKYDKSEWKVTVVVADNDGLEIENVIYSDSVDNGESDDQPEPLEKPERPPAQASTEQAEFANIYTEPEWMRQKVTFVNVYQKTVDYAPKIEKTVESAVTAPGETFTFLLAEEGEHQEGVIMPENTRAVRIGPGQTVFDSISFEKAGTYRFLITEESGSAAGYQFDRKQVVLEVTVGDDGGGVLSIENVSYS